MPSSNHKLPILIGFSISAIALWYFIAGIQWNELSVELANIQLPWVFASILILIFEFWLRAWRWNIILIPTHIHIPLPKLFIAQIIGVTCNTLLPLRAGEVAKPLVASQYCNAPLMKIIATTIMERVYDIMGMVFILILMLSVSSPAASSADNAVLIYNVQFYGGIFGIFAALCMAVFFLLASGNKTSRKTFQTITKIAPPPIANKLNEFFDVFVEGLASTTDKSAFWKAGLISLWMWFNGALAIYCLFHAFDMQLPFGAACFTSVAIALTVALPQAPGFAGVFHVAMTKTMLLWGQSAGPAAGFAIVFWAVSFIPITLLGLLALWKEGYSLKSISQRKNESSRHD